MRAGAHAARDRRLRRRPRPAGRADPPAGARPPAALEPVQPRRRPPARARGRRAVRAGERRLLRAPDGDRRHAARRRRLPGAQPLPERARRALQPPGRAVRRRDGRRPPDDARAARAARGARPADLRPARAGRAAERAVRRGRACRPTSSTTSTSAARARRSPQDIDELAYLPEEWGYDGEAIRQALLDFNRACRRRHGRPAAEVRPGADRPAAVLRRRGGAGDHVHVRRPADRHVGARSRRGRADPGAARGRRRRRRRLRPRVRRRPGVGARLRAPRGADGARAAAARVLDG